MGKLIEHPDAIVARIRKDTVQVAGVIDREMKALQKKYPEHRFELAFEFQRLGRQKFYKIHIKSFNDKPEEKPIPTPMQRLIGFIIDQKLDLSEYREKLPARIKEKFIVKHVCNPTATPVEDMVLSLYYWEDGDKSSSLEERLNSQYTIQVL